LDDKGDTGSETRSAEERNDLLVAKLDHRVKNVLARVGAVVGFIRQGSVTISAKAMSASTF
jgi:two-component sensor histidine kinase